MCTDRIYKEFLDIAICNANLKIEKAINLKKKRIDYGLLVLKTSCKKLQQADNKYINKFINQLSSNMQKINK